MALHELVDDAFERDAVQRIAWMSDGFGHGGYVSGERRVRQRNVRVPVVTCSAVQSGVGQLPACRAYDSTTQ